MAHGNQLHSLTYNGKNVATTLGPSFFDWIFFILGGNKDNLNISNEFDFGPDQSFHYGVTCS